MKKFRNISPAEFTYLGRDTGTESPFVNQFFVEGKGKISRERLEKAVELAHHKNPGISLTLKGRWAWRYWGKNNIHPKVFEYNGNWQGISSENFEIINEPLNARNDVLASVILFTNINKNEDVDFKILFRIHHAVCDGVGTLHWMQEIFRALRNETLLGSTSNLSELDIIQKEDYPVAENFITESKPVFPKSNNPDSRNCHWIKCRWQVNESKILAKIIFVLKEIANEEHDSGITTFRIPSNLRRYLNKTEKQTAQLSNLSGLFDLKINREHTVNQIQNEIVKALRAKKDISVYPKKITALTKFLPNSIFRPNEKFLKNMHSQGLCNITGMLSYPGKIELDDYSCKNFKAHGIYGIPIPLEDKSIFIGMLADENGIQAVLSVPNALSTIKKTQDLAANIEQRLSLL